MAVMENFAIARYERINGVQCKRGRFKRWLCETFPGIKADLYDVPKRTDVRPDGFYLANGEVVCVEVEDSSKLTVRKMIKYCDLAWILDDSYDRISVAITNRYGQRLDTLTFDDLRWFTW